MFLLEILAGFYWFINRYIHEKTFSVVNLKLDINNTTVESLIDKILKRFPKDSYKYNLYITIKDKEVKLDELKKLYEFQSLLEEANVLFFLKQKNQLKFFFSICYY